VESTLDSPPPLPGDCDAPDATSHSCSLTYEWLGTVTVCNSAVDPAKLKTLSSTRPRARSNPAARSETLGE
jgi:hypothetical protein